MYLFFQVIKNCDDLSSRASRKEYWQFYLISFILGLSLNALMFSTDSVYLQKIILSFSLWFTLALAIPNFSLTVRRLHDTGRSAKQLFIFLYLIPASAVAYFLSLVGESPWLGISFMYGCLLWLLLIFFSWMATKSSSGTNQYGPSPLDPHSK